MKQLLIPAAILVIVAVSVTLALSNSLSSRPLTAQEQEQVVQTCAGCHDDNELKSVSLHRTHEETSCISCHDSTHSIHSNADCQDCHAGTAGLETADQAHDILRWVAIGLAGLLVISLVINLFIVRLRIKTKDKNNG